MPPSAVPPDDSDRVALVQASKLLDTEAAPAFEALVRLAVSVLQCPIAAINLVDAHRVWSLAQTGLGTRQMSRQDSLCWASVCQAAPLVVPDTHVESSFHALPCVAGAPHIRTYVGVPIMIEGHALGTVCVMDHAPRQWSGADITHLRDIATTATAMVEAALRSQRSRLMEARVRTASLTGSDWLWETDKHGILHWVSPGLQQHTGVDPASEIGAVGVDIYTPRDDETRHSWLRFLQARERREPFTDAIGERDTPRGSITVSISGSPVFDSHGQFMGYRGSSRIVTRQIEAEMSARRADQLLRRAIDSFQISVMITDPQGRVILANRHWLDQTREAHDAATAFWPDTLRKLIRLGAYPQAIGREEEYLAWRLSLHEQISPQENQFKDRWFMIKDYQLPDHSVVHFSMDITQRKLDAALLLDQQKALTETEARLSAVLRALPDLWLVIDEQGRHVDGHAQHPMAVTPLDQLAGKPLGYNLPDEQATLQQRVLKQVQATGEAQHFEYDLQTADGQHRHFETRLTPMPQGQTLFITRDITDRQLAAEKLRVSEELYRSVAATISDGLVIVELSGRVVALNPAASRILGVPPDALLNLASPSLLGLTLLQEDLATPVPVPQWPISETLAKGERVVDRVNALRRSDGSLVWIETSCHLLRVDHNAPPFAAMATIRDITQERQAQQALQISEERWKFALEGAVDGVWDWDLANGRVYYSQRWKAKLGYKDDEIVDTINELFQRIHPQDREAVVSGLMHHIDQGEGIHQAELRLQHRDGHYLHVLSKGKVVSRLHDGRAQRIVGTHSDITPVKQAERALLDKQLAEAASAAKSAFLSRMSHEIRTPLNAVYGFAQLLQLKVKQEGPSTGTVNYVDQIVHASHHLMGLVNDVLDLQQVEAGKVSFRPETLSLTEEVSQCLAMLAPLADKRHITLHNELADKWPVIADRQRLRQIVMNIGSNAIKYNAPEGQVHIGVQALPDQLLALTICDTGPGMSRAQLSRLFQPFERLGRETSSTEGTGLGLIITRSLLDAMGGRMEIRSQPGVGTQISVVLPAASPTANMAKEAFTPSNYLSPPDIGTLLDMPSAPYQTSQAEAGGLPALRVLYVEDNRINAMLFEEAMRPFPQIDLDVAEDGEMAMSLARERAPDVLVLDAHLPGMSGFDVLKALRALPALAQVPAFMCSADAMPEDVARAEAAGFSGYWTKPIDIVAVTTELCRLAARGDNAAL